jgi:demethylmenaquinone methyltransferase/2-methoxy-6-polyprenyl-1,4-benzoquinol methylase
MAVEKEVWTPELLSAPHDAADKSDRVRRMFNRIAGRYELVNRVFSAGRDARWRRKAVALSAVRAGDDVLDVACGTGDFARAFAAAGARRVVGCDFAREMLMQAVTRPVANVCWVEADAMNLPFGDGAFSIVSCAFGVRNFSDLDAGLREMRRVLRAGGRAVVLEFTRPRNALARGMFELYSHRIMPPAAAWLSGDRSGAYRYLPRSVVSFLGAAQMCERLVQAGFRPAAVTPLTLGVVTVYVAARD